MIGGAHHDNETWQELSGSDLELDGRRWVLIGESIMDGGWSVCSRTSRTPHFHLTDGPVSKGWIHVSNQEPYIWMNNHCEPQRRRFDNLFPVL